MWSPTIRLASVRFALAALLLILTGASSSAVAQQATPAASPAAGSTLLDPLASESGPVLAVAAYRLALLVPFPDDPYWDDVEASVIERAAATGVTVEVFTAAEPSVPDQTGAPEPPSVPRQLEQIDQVIAGQFDGMLIGPVDERAIAPGIVQANEAGIPVVAIDVAPAAGEIVTVVKTDNVAAARLAGQFIGQELEGEGAVLDIRGVLSIPAGEERETGFRDAMKAFPDIEVIPFDANSWTFGFGQLAVTRVHPRPGEGTPSAAPPIDAVFAAGPGLADGAATYLEELKADTVFVVGVGSSDDTIVNIRSGILEAAVVEYPTRGGAIAVDAMVRHLNGEEVPEEIDSGSALVTRDNLDEYIESVA